MKHLYTYLIAAFALLAAVSCEKDNVAPVGNWSLSEPTLTAPDDGSAYILDESDPNEHFYFEWEAAESTAGFQVRYQLVLDTLGSENYDTPLLSVASDNNGKATTGNLTAGDIDLALSYAGFPAGEAAEVEWAVVAICQDTKTVAARSIHFTRFETEYVPVQLFVSGAATEAGTDLSNAVAMRHLLDGDQNNTFVFETYTSLEAGMPFQFYSKRELPAHIYGGGENTLIKGGDALTVEESGVYRITVDLMNNTYSLLMINNWSIVGEPIPNGWGGDAPLTYIGGGVWESTMVLTSGGFVFRANEDWGYLLKLVSGTTDEVYMEAQAGAAGISIEDLSVANAGEYTVTLDLSSAPYTYHMESNLNPPSETPDALYLLADGVSVATFAMDGDVFSTNYLPLQAGVTYQWNSMEDGSGTAYFTSASIGASDNPDGDAVTGAFGFVEGEGTFSVDHDQAYKLSLDFATGNGTWKYYNLKVFHWDNINNGWDDRQEIPMTYQHPNTFILSTSLTANYDIKFISPWDVDLGTDTPTAMSGNLYNGDGGGVNLNPITTTGTYTMEATINDTYTGGTYSITAE
ncbi:SusE outer membrane protein [Pustulibacterium marinum]|uniref:SusE outer membrane protein n=1 Tax=Pustulibacterium marinum TaxID=1224947 RepID=A0A1I7G0D0_9FLAO|nr:SusE domain-containing protein [Pustulibacterium marinum]SFU41918.1 SusE outer membrane protein [Pustulibacterium marinum]